MDLTKVEGLTEEQKAVILTMHEDGVSGLKAKNEELLTEKKTAAQKAVEAEQIANDARKAAEEAEKQRLASTGEFDKINAIHEKQMAEATAVANANAEKAQKALDDLHRGMELNGALSLIHDDFKSVSEPMLSNMIDITYNDEGKPVTAFKHGGEVVANNINEFKSWALTQDSFKRIMNGVHSSGAGASSASNNGGKPLTLTEKAILANQQNKR